MYLPRSVCYISTTFVATFSEWWKQDHLTNSITMLIEKGCGLHQDIVIVFVSPCSSGPLSETAGFIVGWIIAANESSAWKKILSRMPQGNTLCSDLSMTWMRDLSGLFKVHKCHHKLRRVTHIWDKRKDSKIYLSIFK